MKEEHLKNTEQSSTEERIKESLHRLYEQDKASLSRNGFDELWKKAQPVRRGISPWWLVAACLTGILIGKGIPFEKEKEKSLFAVTDTIRVIECRIDTVFYEKQLPMTGNKLQQTITPSRIPLTPDLLSSQQDQNFRKKKETQRTVSTTEDSCITRKGKNLVEENFPFHLHVTL